MRFVFFSLLLTTISSAADLPKEYTHAVVVRSILKKDKTEAFCSGVAISSTKVLTTAHCVDGNDGHEVQIQEGKKSRWVKAIKAERSADYDVKASFSKSDIGILTFKEKLPFADLAICEKGHADHILTQVGVGLRSGERKLSPIYFKADALADSENVQEAPDAMSVMGDSGAPLFALEKGKYCLYAIHSSVTAVSSLKPNELQKSFNPIVRRTSLPEKLY